MRNQERIALYVGVVLLAACSPLQAGADPVPTELAPNQPMKPPPSLEAGCTSGECMPIGDLPGWKQIFTDDFVGKVLPGEWADCSLAPFECSGLPVSYRTRWWAYTEGWPDTSKNGIYSPSEALSVTDGVLDIFIHTGDGVHRVAAVAPLINGNNGSLGQLYGRYVIRFKADTLRGYKIAWLLWPDSETWPRDGEIDFPEGNLDGEISAFMHRQGATANNDQDEFSSGVAVSGSWHIATTEWTPDSVRFFLDGKLLGTATDRIPNTPMHWVIQTETNLNGFEPDDAVAGHVLVDWVAVYSLQSTH